MLPTPITGSLSEGQGENTMAAVAIDQFLTCPVEGCSHEAHYLMPHLVEVHGMTEEAVEGMPVGHLRR